MFLSVTYDRGGEREKGGERVHIQERTYERGGEREKGVERGIGECLDGQF